MIRELSEIDGLINSLLERLEELQNQDGSFTTNYLQEEYQPENGWMDYPDNSPFCTASILVPLLKLDSAASNRILQKATGYLKTRSAGGKLWWFGDFADECVIPFDTDTTALASFVLSSYGEQVDNQQLLISQLNENQHFDLWFRPKKVSPLHFRIWRRNMAANRCVPVRTNLIRYGDFEFTVTCNNLLYCGVNSRTKPIWNTIHQEFADDSFSCMYYPSRLNAVYGYARACHFHQEQVNEGSVGAKENLDSSLVLNSETGLDVALFANSVLYLSHDVSKYNDMFEKCFNQIDDGFADSIQGFYSSNLKTDVQSDGKSPNTYFGSRAITASLYLEFLNLYRFRFYGAYYSVSK